MTRRRQWHWPRITRDVVLFTAGLVGIAHETLAPSSNTPALLVAFMAMVGLPTVLRYDYVRQKDQQSPPPPPPRGEWDPWEWRRQRLEEERGYYRSKPPPDQGARQ